MKKISDQTFNQTSNQTFSTPSPNDGIVDVTEATFSDKIEIPATTAETLISPEIENSEKNFEISNEKIEEIENLKILREKEFDTTVLNTIHVLTEEIDLIENLKKTEVQLRDELRNG